MQRCVIQSHFEASGAGVFDDLLQRDGTSVVHSAKAAHVYGHGRCIRVGGDRPHQAAVQTRCCPEIQDSGRREIDGTVPVLDADPDPGFTIEVDQNR